MKPKAFASISLAISLLSVIPAWEHAVAQSEAAGTAAPAGANLAVVAKPAASYVSGDTAVTALNDGIDPRSSRDARRGSYGNWPQTGTQWVEYAWSQPVSTKAISVYWWAD